MDLLIGKDENKVSFRIYDLFADRLSLLRGRHIGIALQSDLAFLIEVFTGLRISHTF